MEDHAHDDREEEEEGGDAEEEEEEEDEDDEPVKRKKPEEEDKKSTKKSRAAVEPERSRRSARLSPGKKKKKESRIGWSERIWFGRQFCNDDQQKHFWGCPRCAIGRQRCRSSRIRFGVDCVTVCNEHMTRTCHLCATPV